MKTKPYKTYEIIMPIFLGLFVIGWLLIKEFDPAFFSTFSFTLKSVLFIFFALGLMLLRDIGTMWRFRLLTDKDLSWHQTFHIHILSEFTSALTPTAVGGSSLAAIFLLKEGIDGGRSTYIMFLNLFLDELFFLIFCPFVILFIPLNELFNSSSIIVSTFEVVFIGLFFIRLLWATFLFICIFKHPDWIKTMLLSVFKLPFLSRWHTNLSLVTSNLAQTSLNFGSRSYWFWIQVFGTTILMWTARFSVVNALFFAFVPAFQHLIVFGRQLILWVVMAISPTPGGSGVSEYAFKEYYNDIFSSTNTIILITVIWRLISYYLYLLIGIIVIPSWIKKNIYK